MADLIVLHERIVRTIRQAIDDGASSTDDYAAELIPLVREEVRKAKAEALREAADWWAANPDDDAFETDGDTRNWLRDVATEYEAGGSDDRR